MKDPLNLSGKSVVIKAAIDNSSWNLNYPQRNVRVLTDEEGNVLCVPTFSINTTTDPIAASGALGSVTLNGTANIVGIADQGTPAQTLAIDASGRIGASLVGPTAFASVSANGTTAATLIAGSPGVTRKIYAIMLIPKTSTAQTLSFGDNSATFDNMLKVVYPSLSPIVPLQPQFAGGFPQITAGNDIKFLVSNASDTTSTVGVWYS